MENKYIITIGLNDETMKNSLNKEEVIKATTQKLLNVGVLGFNLKEQVGLWEGDKENSLEVSFINTFGIKEGELINIIGALRDEFKQECILLEKQKVEFDFI